MATIEIIDTIDTIEIIETIATIDTIAQSSSSPETFSPKSPPLRCQWCAGPLLSPWGEDGGQGEKKGFGREAVFYFLIISTDLLRNSSRALPLSIPFCRRARSMS